MESDEDMYDDNENSDTGNASSSDDDFTMEVDINNRSDRQSEYPFEVLNNDEIVQLMVDSIKEVTTVVGVSL